MRRLSVCLCALLCLSMILETSLAQELKASVLPTLTPAPTVASSDEADGLYISEALSNNDFVWSLGFCDYVEIYNGGDTELKLSDYYISRTRSDPYQCRLPDAAIAPDGYAVLVCDGNDISFNLPKDGCRLTLTRRDGALCDEVELPPMDNNVWQAEHGLTTLPSPGYPNTAEGAANYRASLERTLVINEVIASNSTLLPVNEEYFDLIELYNAGDEPIVLSNYCLSDKKKELTLWRLPSVTLEPNDCYVVYASGQGGEQADFKVSSDGETIYLSMLNGKCVDALCVPALQPDISYGRSGDELCYFEMPTIGEANPSGASALTPAPVASVPTGLCNAPFYVSLSGDGSIYYTLDGSEPTADGDKYVGEPIMITGSVALRAVAVADDALPSHVVTYHYIFDAQKYELPVLSVSSAPGTVTGKNGIYERYKSRSREAAVNIALIENGAESFNIDCGLKIHGQGSRALKKKSFQVRFRGKYGASKLNYKVFDDLDITEFNGLVLRSGSEDGNRAFLRDEFLTSLTADAMPNVLRQAYRPVNLFIDGAYFGIYYIRERLNDDFVASHLGGAEEDADVIYGWRNAEHGSADDWNELMRFCRRNSLADESNYLYVASRISVEGFIDYYIARAYTGDRDYPNIRHCRTSGGDGLWRIINFDLDWGFGTQPACLTSMIGSVSDGSNLNTVIINALLTNAGFKKLMLERLAYHLRTTYRAERVLEHLDAMVAEIEHDMPYNQERWNYSMEKWEEHIDFLRNFVRGKDGDRVSTMVTNAKRAFRLSDEEMEQYFGELWTAAQQQ